MKHYEYEINQFVDGELPQQEHKGLFDHLATCNECQKTLSDYYLLKEKSREFSARNLSQIKNIPSKNNIFYKIGFYTNAAAAVMLMFILFTNKPATLFVTKNEVRVDTVFVQKEVPLPQNQSVNNNSFTPGKKELIKERPQKAYLHYVMSLHTVKITDADVIKTGNGS